MRSKVLKQYRQSIIEEYRNILHGHIAGVLFVLYAMRINTLFAILQKKILYNKTFLRSNTIR